MNIFANIHYLSDRFNELDASNTDLYFGVRQNSDFSSLTICSSQKRSAAPYEDYSKYISRVAMAWPL